MSLGSQDIAEARLIRAERDRQELESRNDAEYDLAVLGFYDKYITHVLNAAKAQGEVMTSGVHVARVTYASGQYTVMP